MSLRSGTRLGAYEIVSALGAGGMGEVYRARDTQLDRDVAIKILPEAFAADAERVARFQREAKVLASLSHPNIAHIYGLEGQDGRDRQDGQTGPFLVMELVEGEDLSQRIARGAIPIDEALPIARQIAEALEAAHEQGIVHRDLKPANIKLRTDGTVKVLDFGLAKLADPVKAGLQSGPSPLSQSPTITTPAMTMAGVILGTAAYMAPEQARGRAVDKRADVWAFGCVLYEMLTARRAFAGDEISDTLAFIIMKEPDWAALPATTPASITRLLRRCLEKEPKERLRDIGDARIDINEAQRMPQSVYGVPQGVSRRKERLAWISALALVTLLAAILGVWALSPAPATPEVRLEITTPPTDDPTSFEISPDGQKIVFVGAQENKAQLWLRPLDAVSARPLAGTDGATYPFWSPDSLSVGFFADGKLKRIDLDGGAVQVLANATNGLGGAWSRDGTVLFSGGFTSPIRRVSATGGDISNLTRVVAPDQSGHGFPRILPDGRHVLYVAGGTPENRGVYVVDFDGSAPRRLLDAETAAVYAPSGQLLFVRQGTLFAQNFDLAQLELVGNPYPVAGDVAIENSHAAMSVSATGTVVYRNGVSGERRQFEWVDRSGKKLESVGEFDTARPINPSMSPDGRQVAMHRAVGLVAPDVWLLELGRGLLRRLTFEPGLDISPVWSPDGRRIAFGSNRKGQNDLYWKLADGSGIEEPLLVTPQGKTITDWSPDGRFLLYRSTIDPKTGYDLWALPLAGDRKPFPVVETNFNERDGQFSPDGKWIAYQSDESGRFEIYVQPFTGPGGKSQVSTNGGAQVRWRRDGNELFYIGLDDRLMAVPIRLDSRAMVVEANAPLPLFVTHVGGADQGGDRQQYIVSADGQRFLMNTVAEEAAAPLTLILNWKPKP